MHPHPTPSRRGLPAALATTLAAALAGSLLAPPARATTGPINVAQLVLGTAEPLPANPGFPWPCGNACSHASVAGVQMDNGYGAWPGNYSKPAWPVFYQPPLLPYPGAMDNLAVAPPPAGTQYKGLPSGVLQRARVSFDTSVLAPASDRQLEVHSFKSGDGATALSLAVRIHTPAAGARRTYLRFVLPSQVRDALPASQIAGPSGDQPITTQAKRVQARSLVDVYVDGLPVWSSQSMRLQPQRYKPALMQAIAVDSGPALNGDEVTLYLGTLPANSVRSVAIVMRSDLRVDAPTCHTVNNAGFGLDERRCHAQVEGLRLPSQTLPPHYSHAPHVLVYTRRALTRSDHHVPHPSHCSRPAAGGRHGRCQHPGLGQPEHPQPRQCAGAQPQPAAARRG